MNLELLKGLLCLLIAKPTNYKPAGRSSGLINQSSHVLEHGELLPCL